jgi:hypothetical protein
MAQGFVFVVADETAKIRAGDRRAIRSKCVRGRNKQPGSRRSRQETARHTLATPRAGPADWSLFRFPGELDLASQRLMHQYYLRNPVRDLLLPFKYYGYNIDFAEDSQWCFRTLSSEKVYFCAILMMASASHDLVHHEPFSRATVRHLKDTIAALNTRLSSYDPRGDETAIYAIGALTFVAVLFGEHETAEVHRSGLSEMLRLSRHSRLENRSPVVEFAIDRIDQATSIAFRSCTPLYGRRNWDQPAFPASIVALHGTQDMLDLDGLIDSQLLPIFHCLQYTTLLYGQNQRDGSPIDGSLLRQSLGFIHSNLAQLDWLAMSPFSACILHTIVAFLAATFQLPHFEAKLCDEGDLVERLQRLDLSYEGRSPHSPRGALEIWMVMVLAISGGDDSIEHICATPSFQGTVDMLQSLTWHITRQQLKRVAWIDSMYDSAGERVLQQIVCSPRKMGIGVWYK